MTDTRSPALNASRERVAQTSSGYLMLLLLLVVTTLTIFGAFSQLRTAIPVALIGGFIFLLIAKGLCAPAQPGRSHNPIWQLQGNRSRNRPSLGCSGTQNVGRRRGWNG